MAFFRNRHVFALAALAAMASSPALADEGLPQLDTSLFPEQIFWLAISFGTLYLLMSRVALPGVARTKDNRKSVIATELEVARKANESAKASLAAVEKSLGDARAKAQAGMNDMMARVSATAAERQAAQEKEVSSRLHTAEAGIAVEREKAMKAIHASAADLAAVVVEKIVGSRLKAG